MIILCKQAFCLGFCFFFSLKYSNEVNLIINDDLKISVPVSTIILLFCLLCVGDHVDLNSLESNDQNQVPPGYNQDHIDSFRGPPMRVIQGYDPRSRMPPPPPPPPQRSAIPQYQFNTWNVQEHSPPQYAQQHGSRQWMA